MHILLAFVLVYVFVICAGVQYDSRVCVCVCVCVCVTVCISIALGSAIASYVYTTIPVWNL